VEKNTIGNLVAAALIGALLYPLLKVGCTDRKLGALFIYLVAYVLALLICYMFVWVNHIHDLERWAEADKERCDKLREENRKLRERQKFMDELDEELGPGATETLVQIVKEQTKKRAK